MFGVLTEKFQGLVQRLGGKRKLTAENITDAVREVRLALLEADVNYGVAKVLVKRLKERAVGEEVLKSVSPGQQFIKVVHDELVQLMGAEEADLCLEGRPAVVLLCGLQGAGKTTQTAKLVKLLKKQGKASSPLMVACDLQRPAAVQQLQTLGEQIGVPVYAEPGCSDAVGVAQRALSRAKEQGNDIVFVDTAGRLHVDEALMKELRSLKEALRPSEVLFVANATTGQDAVNSAKEIHDCVGITGSILTMLDGNTRGGAALSIREVTGQPLKYEGIGEKLGDLQVFNPSSMADRILGMGDTINLVKRAQEHFDEEEAEKLEKKLRKASFTYEDYLGQMQAMKKMGSLKSLLSMLPGVGQMKELDFSDKEFAKIEAIILSMTLDERRESVELNPRRRRRVARGSGTSLDDVNRLVKSFRRMKQMIKGMSNKKQLEKMMGGIPWR